MFNLDAGTLSIDNSDFLHVKSERSRGVVELEPNLILIIRGWQAKATGTFVLESESHRQLRLEEQERAQNGRFLRALPVRRDVRAIDQLIAGKRD